MANPETCPLFPQANPATPNHVGKISSKLPMGRVRLLPERIILTLGGSAGQRVEGANHIDPDLAGDFGISSR